MVWGAAIQAGAGLLGGLLGKKADKKAAETALFQHRMRFQWTREDAENAGFNPLTALGTGSISAPVAGPSNSMGNAIAQAGLAISGGMADREELNMEKSRLEMDKKRLDALIENQTIRPKVGGIYSSQVRTPTNVPLESMVDTRPDGVRRAQPALKPLQPGVPGSSKMDTAGRLFTSQYKADDSPFPMPSKSGPTMIVDETGYPTTNLEDGRQPPEFEADAYTLARQHELFDVAVPMLMGNIRSGREMLPWHHPLSTEGWPQKAYDAYTGTPERWKSNSGMTATEQKAREERLGRNFEKEKAEAAREKRKAEKAARKRHLKPFTGLTKGKY